MKNEEIMRPQAGQQPGELVSIIMPCYNAEAFVGEAIASVVHQTWQNWELLVIDDGSRDASLQVVSEWARKDSRVQSMPNPQNMGVSKTRNRGIGLAKGQWIAFLDSDDVWRKDKLEQQLKLAEATGSLFLYTGYSHIDEFGKQYGFEFKMPEQATFNTLSKWCYISTSGVLLSRDFLANDRFERNDLREDYYLWLRLLKRTTQAVGVTESLHFVRHVKGSRSSNKIAMLSQTYGVHRLMERSVVASIYYTFSHFFKAFFLKYRHFGARKFWSEGR
jgi:teichuronic acid biosynthesis glycosyltransferase TuaG